MLLAIAICLGFTNIVSQVVRRGDVGHIPLLNDYVAQHLSPLDPVSLQYTIRVDEEFHRDPKPTVYDVQVLVEDPLRVTLQPLLSNPAYAAMLKDVTGLDDQLARVVQAIAVSKAKHTFLHSLYTSPTTFILNWMSSQKRDMDIIMGDASKLGNELMGGPEWRRGGSESVWATSNARESVNVLLSKQR